MKSKRDSFWKRLLTAKLPLPVPVAAALALVLLASSFLALRSSTASATPIAPQTLSVSTATPRIVEVPVVREKIVTRTVYVDKKGREINNTRRLAPMPLPARDESALTASNSDRGRRQDKLFTRVNLTDFQPPEELKIRIIKRRSSDEN